MSNAPVYERSRDHVRTLSRWVGVLATCSVFASPAGATAIYSAAARSTFTLDPVGPVSTITDHAPFTGTSTTGSGVASIDTFVASADGVHPATVDSKVSGSAVAPPTSSSFAEAKRGHVFVVPRGSPDEPLPTVVLRFAFEIAWDTHLAIDLPGSEFARGGAFFAISGFETGIDAIALDPGMPGAIVAHGPELAWEYNPMYDTLSGSPVGETHATIVTGSITVFAGTVGEFSVITDTSGFAGARVVSEPVPVLLLALPLAWLAWRFRRSGVPPR